MNWEDYYHLGLALAQKPDEASQRSAVSRLYYGIFKLVANLAASEGHTIPRQAFAHELVAAICKLNGKTILADNLSTLRFNRNRADYSNSIKHLSSFLSDSVNEAQDAFALVKALSKSTSPNFPSRVSRVRDSVTNEWIYITYP